VKNHALAALALAALAAVPAAGQNRPGSIYRPDAGPVGAIANKIARRPGDLITVLIQESADVSNQETSDLKKETTLDYQMTAFNLAADAFNELPHLGARSKDDFKGSANYKKQGNFEARLTAIVVDVLPNGNLVVNGRREIRVDNETKLIEFSGVVRRYDVKANNTIESELVANAKVSYVGSGPLTNSTNRRGIGGWFHSLISWIWPF
jgi:flagellar L-ring protein precursor FlgH